jgi:uncharacterized membrane protein
VKLFVLLLLLVAAAWFVPAPPGHVEQSVDITTGRERVWAVLGDVSSARLWDPMMKDLKIVSDTRVGPGTELFAPGTLVKTTETVKDWIPYNRIVFDVTHDPNITKYETSTLTIEPGEQSGVTRLRWTLDYQMAGGYLGHWADRFLIGSAHAGRVKDGLANLKRYAETGETPITL